MTFENSATLTTVWITKYSGCVLLDKRNGKTIVKDIYRLGGPDRHKLSDEMKIYGFELRDAGTVETRKSNIDIRDYFNCGEEIEK